MNLKSKFLDRLAGKWIHKQDQMQNLKRIAEKSDWKSTASKCHEKLSTEYKFWIVKKDSPSRSAKLQDLTKDIAFMNKIENKESLTPQELTKLKHLKEKYSI